MAAKRPSEHLSHADLKRQRLTPSKTLHVRNLPSTVSEAELIRLCSPFGRIEQTFILVAQRQGFIQMESVQAASSILQEYVRQPAMIGNQQVFFDFSVHQTIQRKRTPLPESSEPPSHVIFFSIFNATIPVTIEDLHQVFSTFGRVLRIVTFVKGDKPQGLVELDSIQAATNARTNLEGKEIFRGCCTLSLQFSKLPNLTVRANSPLCRDFTRPLTPEEHTRIRQYHAQAFSNPPSYGGYAQPSVPAASSHHGPVVLVQNLAEETTLDDLFMLFGVYGDVVRIRRLFKEHGTVLLMFDNRVQAVSAVRFLDNVPLHGKRLRVQHSKHPHIIPHRGEEPNHLFKDFSDSPVHRFTGNRAQRASKNLLPPSRVLFISNLDVSVSRREVLDVFDGEAEAMEFFKLNKTLVFVRFASVGKAVDMLVKHHNQQLHGRFLRLAFASKDAQAVRDTDREGDALARGRKGDGRESSRANPSQMRAAEGGEGRGSDHNAAVAVSTENYCADVHHLEEKQC